MIRHVVMFRFMEYSGNKTKQENLHIAKELLEALIDKVPTLRAIEVGINAENADKSNYDLILTCDYDDLEGLAAYQIHEEHKKVAEFIGKVKLERACVDYNI